MKKSGVVHWLSLQLFLLLLIMGLTCSVSQAAELDITSSSDGGSDLAAEIESYVAEHQDTTAGMSVAVFQNEETLHTGYYGYGNIEAGLKNSPETVMEWGSVTKMLVWVSVMQLVELGEIDLNEDINTYLPQGFLSNLKYDQPITMMNLMHHNAGWEEQPVDLFIPAGEDVEELEAVLQNFMPNQIYEPGTVVAYSNWGASLAGYIVARVSGMSFSEYVHKHIFEPLGMEHTAILPSLADNPWVSEQRDLLKVYSTELKDLGSSRYQVPLYPAGMATGTLADLLLFGKALVPEAGGKSALFIKRQTLDQFLSPSLFYHDQNNTPRNAHGLWITETEGRIFGHVGNTLGGSTNLQFDPEGGSGFVVMTNQGRETVYTVGLQEMIFGKHPEPDNQFQMIDIAGVYTQARTVRTGGLRLHSFIMTLPILAGKEHDFYVPLTAIKLMPMGTDRFLFESGDLVTTGFVVENNDGAPHLEIGIHDYLPKSPPVYIFEIFLLVTMGMAVIYSLYAILSMLVRKHKKQALAPWNGAILLASAGNLGLFFSFLYVVFSVISYGPGRNLRLGLFLCAIFSLLILINLVRTGRTAKALENKILRKRVIHIALASLVMVLNSLYWQWFVFW